ncbi:MAG: hypothetical protein M3N82_01865 [Pseudomonadota bacterium]|nr:hypothetical protein [Pseudomonadota bacterium]
MSKDDLFVRVLYFILGFSLGAGGLYGLQWIVARERQDQPVWAIWPGASFLSLAVAWGFLLAARAFVPCDSRIARLAEALFPDAFDESTLLLLAVFCLPALLMTLMLRLLGVQGEVVRKSS